MSDKLICTLKFLLSSVVVLFLSLRKWIVAFSQDHVVEPQVHFAHAVCESLMLFRIYCCYIVPSMGQRVLTVSNYLIFLLFKLFNFLVMLKLIFDWFADLLFRTLFSILRILCLLIYHLSKLLIFLNLKLILIKLLNFVRFVVSTHIQTSTAWYKSWVSLSTTYRHNILLFLCLQILWLLCYLKTLRNFNLLRSTNCILLKCRKLS